MQKKIVVTLFVDFRKAYDTVNHRILLNKLEIYGIRGTILKWFASYLSGREQRVKLDEKYSSWKPITIGVPQGSVLGSLLFLIYVNVLPLISNVLQSVLFADDTCLTLSDDNHSNLIIKFNQYLDKFYSWVVANRLSLNYDKTVLMNFSKKRCENDLSLMIGYVALSNIDKTKYLGVIIDKNSSFHNHSKFVRNKVSKNVGLLYRMSLCLPKAILKQIYHAIVLPYFTYCNIIWGGAANCHIEKLLKLQKRAVRVITDSSY